MDAIYAKSFDEQHRDGTDLTERTCPECDGELTADQHERVCTVCGLVVEDDRVDRGPEWRSFDEETKKRTGAPMTEARHDGGLSTMIGWHRSGDKHDVDGSKRRRLERQRRHHKRSKQQSKRERNQVKGIYEIRRMTSALGMDDSLRDQACRLFKTAQNADLLRGRSIEAVATASIHAACRINDLPRTMSEVASVARVEQARVRNAYSVLNRELSLPAVPPEPSSYVPQFASQCGLTDAERRKAREFCDRAEAANLANGRNPAGVAAACVFMAAGRDRGVSQETVGELADVSAVTIRNRVREIRERLPA